MLCIAELFLQVKLNYSGAPTIEWPSMDSAYTVLFVIATLKY